MCLKYLDDEMNDSMLDCYKNFMWEWRKKRMGDTVLHEPRVSTATRSVIRGAREDCASSSPSAMTLSSDSDTQFEGPNREDKRKDQEGEESEQSQVRDLLVNNLKRMSRLASALTQGNLSLKRSCTMLMFEGKR